MHIASWPTCFLMARTQTHTNTTTCLYILNGDLYIRVLFKHGSHLSEYNGQCVPVHICILYTYTYMHRNMSNIDIYYILYIHTCNFATNKRCLCLSRFSRCSPLFSLASHRCFMMDTRCGNAYSRSRSLIYVYMCVCMSMCNVCNIHIYRYQLITKTECVCIREAGTRSRHFIYMYRHRECWFLYSLHYI